MRRGIVVRIVVEGWLGIAFFPRLAKMGVDLMMRKRCFFVRKSIVLFLEHTTYLVVVVIKDTWYY